VSSTRIEKRDAFSFLADDEVAELKSKGIDCYKIDSILRCFFEDRITTIADISNVIGEVIFQEEIGALENLLKKRGFSLKERVYYSIGAQDEEVLGQIENGKDREDNMFDEKVLDEIFAKVKERIREGDKKYGDICCISDLFGKDEDEETLDVVGYVVLHVLRMRKALEAVRPRMDDAYLTRFLSEQKTDFLTYLCGKIINELDRRKQLSEAGENNVTKEG